MDPIHESIPHRHAVTGEEDLMPALITHGRKRLAADCSRCCGLCCTALYFPKRRDSPAIRKPGFPASNYAKISPAGFTVLCPDAD